MVCQNTQSKNARPCAQVHIAGGQKLQNELLARYIEEKAGLTCSVESEISEFPLIVNLKAEQKSIFLWDCLGTDFNRLWNCLDDFGGSKNTECYIALFNVKPNSGIENEAIQYKVRGIFYNNDPPEILAKGLLAIRDRELWFSRQILTECLFGKKTPSGSPGKAQPYLTPREKEILGMIASGTTNDEVADALFISLHTVKTHLYNIYKKIRVSNRTQAALWTTQNL